LENQIIVYLFQLKFALVCFGFGILNFLFICSWIILLRVRTCCSIFINIRRQVHYHILLLFSHLIISWYIAGVASQFFFGAFSYSWHFAWVFSFNLSFFFSDQRWSNGGSIFNDFFRFALNCGRKSKKLLFLFLLFLQLNNLWLRCSFCWMDFLVWSFFFGVWLFI